MSLNLYIRFSCFIPKRFKKASVIFKKRVLIIWLKDPFKPDVCEALSRIAQKKATLERLNQYHLERQDKNRLMPGLPCYLRTLVPLTNLEIDSRLRCLRELPQLRSLTEIAPPQPFLCVNRNSILYDFRVMMKAQVEASIRLWLFFLNFAESSNKIQS